MDRRSLILALPALAAGCAGSRPANEQQDLVDRARFAAESLRFEQNLGPELDRILPRVRGVIVIPSLFRAGLFVGGQGGSGVLLVRGGSGWVGPVFLNIGAGSFGLQAGVQQAEVLLMVMNDGTVNRLVDTTVRLGGDVSIALGTVGAGMSAGATQNLGRDLVAYARTSGFFAGVALEGMVISPNHPWNEAYHQAGATPRSILETGTLAPGAAQLARLLDPRV
ncbi:MAG: hypothetical protein EAZ99_14350 [Alphaproteobacteria bacterium]|nr:lipid-binding SYLF domain-containing protein [Alphaproteobacteria bacterium]TAD88356.1 MAG: hypothetical protein EAZ99_14350 [Alphaproteobacteria bacterium]